MDYIHIDDKVFECIVCYVLNKTKTWRLNEIYRMKAIYRYGKKLGELGLNLYDGFEYINDNSWKDYIRLGYRKPVEHYANRFKVINNGV